MTGMVALLAIVRNRFLLLITSALLGAVAAGGINMLLPVVYEATAKIIIASPYWNDSTAIADPNFGGDKTFWWDKTLAVGDEFTGQRLPSYARLVTTPLVTEPVAERMGLGDDAGNELAKKLSGHVVPETMLLEVRAQDASPVRAASIADAAARQTINVIKAVERPPYVVVSPVQPVLTELASVPSRPISPRTLLNIGCGAIIGLLLGLTYVAAYVGARESRRLARFRGDAPAAELGGVLGVLMAEDDLPVGEIHNDARLLRLEVDHRLTQAGVQALVMTSPVATPATMNAAALLATALAEAGAPTIVVCADVTALHQDSIVGLSDVLAARLTLDSVILLDERRGISWIPAGTASTNPSRLFTGPKMRDLLIELSGRYRYVIVVCPSPLDEADVVDMASQVGASILVEFVPQTAAEERRESDSERLLRLALGSYLGRVVVNGPAFSQPVEMPPFDRQRPAELVRSNPANGE
jgi:polysaccharide biosynthesis transport protein